MSQTNYSKKNNIMTTYYMYNIYYKSINILWTLIFIIFLINFRRSKSADNLHSSINHDGGVFMSSHGNVKLNLSVVLVYINY